MKPLQVLPHRIKVDMGVMTMNGYSTFLSAPGLETYLEMLFRVISMGKSSQKI